MLCPGSLGPSAWFNGTGAWPPGPSGVQTEGVVRARGLVTVGVLLCVASLLLATWVLRRPDVAVLEQTIRAEVDVLPEFLGLAWAVTGGVIAVLRPRNALGWLLLGVGVCQALSGALAAYGGYGVAVAEPQWPLARWSAWVASGLWLPGLLPLPSVLLALYPRGRVPGPLWRWPVTAAAVGIAFVTAAALLNPEVYDDVAPGPSPVSEPRLALICLLAAAVTLVPGTLVIWGMSAVRFIRSRPPERQQLGWLLLVVVPFMVVSLVGALDQWVFRLAGFLIPVAVGLGVFRYGLLGIEVVMRRGLVYATLTGIVVAVYLGVSAAAGSRLDRGPLPGVVAALLAAVGLMPLRARLQGAVDRLVYGDRRDPLRAVARMGNRVADAGEQDLLPAVLAILTHAVRAPGAVVTDPDGRVLAAYGAPAEGTSMSLRVGGKDAGLLVVAARRPGERYTRGDRHLLATLAPQLAVVVRAFKLSEALEIERDRVVAATRAERSRLRRDLHDGLGPSLSGASLGLRALDRAMARDDGAAAVELLHRSREAVGAAVVEVRRIIDDLRPAVLDNLGLVGAVRHYVDTVAAVVSADFEADNLPWLPPDVEIAAYRISQEALTNVLRHAGAGHVQVCLSADDEALTVKVADDGNGFDSSAEHGVGLASMLERARAVDGTMSVASNKGGTTVVAVLPLRRPAETAR